MSRSLTVDSDRRAFLRGRALTHEGRALAAAAMKPLGPPPPGVAATLAGLDSAAPCRDCAAPCVSSCSEGIIRKHPQNHALAGQPYLDFGAGGCTFCGDCGTACPHTVVPATLPAIGLATLDPSACLAWNGVICVSCRYACPTRAIGADARSRPAIAAEACNGCGKCVRGCPTQAISVTAAMADAVPGR